MKKEELDELNKFIETKLPTARAHLIMVTAPNGLVHFITSGSMLDLVYMSKNLDVKLSQTLLRTFVENTPVLKVVPIPVDKTIIPEPPKPVA